MNTSSRFVPRGRVGLVVGWLMALLPLSGAPLHAVTPTQDGIPVAGHTPPAEIAGIVRIDGCIPSPGQLELVAAPVTFGSEEFRSASPDPRASVPEAVFTRTANPHVVRFAIHGTRPNATYRLAVGVLPASGCGAVFWRGPELGLVPSGTPDVLIEGVSAQTVVEIASGTTGEWVGADDVRFSESGRGRRNLRWRSSLAGITSGELQISTNAFPTEGDFTSCAEPEAGMVHRQMVPVEPGGWADIPAVDFSAILNSRRVIGDDLSRLDAPLVSPVSPSTHRMLLAGAPVFARVVPYRDAEPACERERDGVHGWVVLSQVAAGPVDPPDPPADPARIVAGDGHVYAPPYLGGVGQGHPTYTEFAYKIIKPHTLPKFKCVGFALETLADEDPLGCVIVNAGWAAPGSIIQPGPWFFFTPEPPKSSGGSVLSFVMGSFTFLITGAIDAAGIVVDSAAKVWDDVKAAVVKLALKVLLAVPPGDAICGAIGSTGVTSCQGMIETGLTIALASAGMPPSLPNWDQFKGEALDYVVAQVATQMSPVPAAVTEPMLKELAKQMIDKMTTNRGGSDPRTNWVIPYAGYEPAAWTIVIDKTDVNPLPTLWLNLPESPLFLGSQLPLPTEWPSNGHLKVPVVLRPNLKAINAPLCWSGWKGAGCVGWLPPSASPKCFYDSLQSGQSYEVDCATTQLPGIYYRDAWVFGKLMTTPCVDVQAWTLQEVAGLLFPAPDAFKMAVMGRLQPQQLLSWNGPFVATCTK